MSQDIYHVQIGKRRTTVSLDQISSVLLSLKLGHDPGTEDAHSAVRAYIQEKLDVLNDPCWTSVSQWLRKEVVLDLLDKKYPQSMRNGSTRKLGTTSKQAIARSAANTNADNSIPFPIP